MAKLGRFLRTHQKLILSGRSKSVLNFDFQPAIKNSLDLINKASVMMKFSLFILNKPNSLGRITFTNNILESQLLSQLKAMFNAH